MVTTELPFITVPEVEPEPAQAMPSDPLVYRLTTLIDLGMADSPRSTQTEVGASEIGCPCPRRLVYRHHDTRPVNPVDSGKMLIGTGTHLALADIFARHNRRVRRFLVEHPITYRGVRGTLDLFDLATGTLIDWKTTGRTRLTRMQTDGPPEQYVIQLQIYAAGLTLQGYTVKSLALAFIRTDGALSQMWVWRTEPNALIAEAAVDHYESLAPFLPAEVRPVPDRYCGTCPYYDPNTLNLNLACPGR